MFDEVLIAKIGSMCILGCCSLCFGLIPIKLVDKFALTDEPARSYEHSKGKAALTALNCFGAGVILTTCFTHIIPEVNEVLEGQYKAGTLAKPAIPLTGVLLICGFLMIYVTEEVAHLLLKRFRKNEPTIPATKEESVSALGTAPCCEETCDGAAVYILTNPEEASFQLALRGFFIMLAISLHAVFEGIAMGLGSKASFIWYLCFAVAVHKFIISFCIGLQMATSGMRRIFIVIYMSIFSFITPVGIAIGIALTFSNVGEYQSPATAQASSVLNCLAAGTLIYVVFFEILEKERLKKSSGLLQVSFIVIGFVVMILVQLIEGEHHHCHGSPKNDSNICDMNLKSVLEKFPPNQDLRVSCLNGNWTITFMTK